MDLSPYKALVTKLVPLSYQHDLDSLLDSFCPAWIPRPGSRSRRKSGG
ncbi:hypothetical protein [Zobellella taiwanensis]